MPSPPRVSAPRPIRTADSARPGVARGRSRAHNTGVASLQSVSIRYIVHDVDAAIAFYRDELGFELVMHPAPTFAMMSRGPLRLVLSVPGGGAGGGQAMSDGTLPEPGGWNRFAIEVEDLAELVRSLRGRGVRFRNDIVHGVGGRQIIAEDPSGNPVELFEPTIDEAKLG
jgi:catechol 2,3-dioxygenase-like lactoylglutathione lyase family enzyme